MQHVIKEQLESLNRALYEGWGPDGDDRKRQRALKHYLRVRTDLARHFRMFEIANHRVFRERAGLLVPYDAHGLLRVYRVTADDSACIARAGLPHGRIVTDRYILDLSKSTGEAIDLEQEIYHLDITEMPRIPVARLRDLAEVLRRINASGSRHEVVYLLRFLVARLCSGPGRAFAGAKNLQPETMQLRAQLVEFLSGPFAIRLALPARVIVRHLSSLVAQPRLIDGLWQDSLDLAEVHVRGSSIANEIRRSAHHSLGVPTLELARSYLHWLNTGERAFPDPDHMIPAAADEAARSRQDIIDLVDRIVSSLQQLLGGSQLAGRFHEWQDAYDSELMRCDSGNGLGDELETLVANGIEAENRWVCLQRIRVLRRKSGEGAWSASAVEALQGGLDALECCLPGEAGFDPKQAKTIAQSIVTAFVSQVRADHEAELFHALDHLQELNSKGLRFEAFSFGSDLRHRLEDLVGSGVFPGQRLLIMRLDCLLEEAGFYALRHLASEYDDAGMRLEECLRVVHRCAGNLELDGLFSRELWDLSLLLLDPLCGPVERLDVLEQLQRNYHRLVRRVSEAYEVMSDHLGYTEEQMRAVLGNFFRGMHDLNSLAHFSDAARAHLVSLQPHKAQESASPQDAEPWDFLHLSHDGDIVRRVEYRNGRNLRGDYGGKGSGLAYLSYLGIPTRDAFIIPATLSRQGLHRSEESRLRDQVLYHVRILEQDIQRCDGTPVRLGDPASPLLLAVRGGSVFSMPGMLETVVFVGLTLDVAEALAEEDEWYAWDACRRFLASYAQAVWGLDLETLDLVDRAKKSHGVWLKTELPGSAMRGVAQQSMQAIRDAGHGSEIDLLMADAERQLHTAIQAVFDSWNGLRARRYRKIKHLSERWNTAAIVQQMASGNRSNRDERETEETEVSLTGVIPRTHMEPDGFRSYTGEIKFGASGDDLVAGVTRAASFESVEALHTRAPMLERKLNHINSRVRRYMGSDAEIEFTVERGVLSVLQTRSAELEHLHSPRTFDEPGEPDAHGIGITGGAFRGRVAFCEEDVKQLHSEQADPGGNADGVLLVLENPVPDEIPLILSVDGLLASRGGSTAHAAVAVNGIDDKPYTAVLGVSNLKVLTDRAEFRDATGGPVKTVRYGDIVSIHGQTGEVFAGTRAVHGVTSLEEQQDPGN